jgi:hypothetical protein
MDFQLPEEDVVFLDGLELSWETINDHGMQWVIVYDYPIVFGSVAVKIETGYPRTQLDMAYFYPALQRLDGKTINAICSQIIDEKQYQRWSRHRTSANPWREGIDDLSTHFTLISFWFEQEFIKRTNGITT